MTQPIPDAGTPPPPTLGWRRVSVAPPARSTHVAFYWPPKEATLVFSGNHGTGPIHDGWAWTGEAWSQHPLEASEYPERKNPGVAVDVAGGQAYVFGGVWSGYPPGGGPYKVVSLGDLQRWDGSRWTQLSVTGGPSARASPAMAFDEARRQLVLFGGSDNASVFDDTWVFDGAGWTQQNLAPTQKPSPRLNARMAWDPVRQKLVLFGGQAIGPSSAAQNLDDTWEWDGGAWVERTGEGPRPPGRGMHSLVFDPVRGKVMLMGGARHFPPIPQGSALSDQWEWDGSVWTQVTPQGPTPPARTAATLTFDSRRNVVVLYGGFDAHDLADLWEWDGQRWSERTTLPLPRSEFAFAQRAPGGEALLFGGVLAAGGVLLQDTHRFAEGRWTRLSGAAPPRRREASLAYHDGEAVLLGGAGVKGTASELHADMWTLAPGAEGWVRRSVPLPPARRGAALAFDPERKRTVLFGGQAGSAGLKDTWEWDGTAWQEVSPVDSPPARTHGQLLFDPHRRRLVLLGGYVPGPGGAVYNDAWTFDGTAWTRLDTLSPAPTSRLWHSLAFDARGRLLSWSGLSGQTLLDDLAVHDGTAWTPLPSESGPPARFGAAWLDLGGDRWRTLFGARTDFKTTWEDLADVWELGPVEEEGGSTR